jgi:hypothetical protein
MAEAWELQRLSETAARFWKDRNAGRGSVPYNIFGNIVIVLSSEENDRFKDAHLEKKDGWDFANFFWNQYTYSVRADGYEADRKILEVKKLLGEPSEEKDFR